MKVAMILAAGRGERLRPLTDTCPKALCLIKGVPLIEYHVRNLAEAGFDRVVINHAHLGGKIRHYLGDGSGFGLEICYSPEPPGGLETGGGIVKALPLLGSQPFLMVNGDIYTDFDFSDIKLDEVHGLHLVLVPKNPALNHHGDFGLIDGCISNTPKEYTYAGIACYHPQFFTGCKVGRYSVAPLIRQYVDKHRVSGFVHQGFWFDIGSLERLAAANREGAELL